MTRLASCMLIEVMRMRIMNNEKKIQDAEKEAGGDEKLIFKFAWPKTVNYHFQSVEYAIIHNFGYCCYGLARIVLLL